MAGPKFDPDPLGDDEEARDIKQSEHLPYEVLNQPSDIESTEADGVSELDKTLDAPPLDPITQEAASAFAQILYEQDNEIESTAPALSGELEAPENMSDAMMDEDRTINDGDIDQNFQEMIAARIQPEISEPTNARYQALDAAGEQAASDDDDPFSEAFSFTNKESEDEPAEDEHGLLVLSASKPVEPTLPLELLTDPGIERAALDLADVGAANPIQPIEPEPPRPPRLASSLLEELGPQTSDRRPRSGELDLDAEEQTQDEPFSAPPAPDFTRGPTEPESATELEPDGRPRAPSRSVRLIEEPLPVTPSRAGDEGSGGNWMKAKLAEQSAAAETAAMQSVQAPPRRRESSVMRHEPAGDLLGAKYRVTGILGRGAMGTVFEAEHVRLKRPVAAKVVNQDASQDPHVVERLRREAETLARIRHPGIIEVSDFDETPDGRSFIVMERLYGEDLRTRLERLGRLELDEVISLGVQIASAMGVAHEQGVIHRDLKPANVFLTPGPRGQERAKLLDFGTVNVKDERPLTLQGALVGTPTYLAPEQALGDEITERTDVYAICLLMYEAWTGLQPFESASGLEEVVARIVSQVPLPASEAGAPSKALDDLLQQGLQKISKNRFPSTYELIDALEAVREKKEEAPAPRPSEIEKPAAKSPELKATQRALAETRRQLKYAVATAVFLLIAVVALLVTYF